MIKQCTHLSDASRNFIKHEGVTWPYTSDCRDRAFRCPSTEADGLQPLILCQSCSSRSSIKVIAFQTSGVPGHAPIRINSSLDWAWLLPQSPQRKDALQNSWRPKFPVSCMLAALILTLRDHSNGANMTLSLLYDWSPWYI